MVSKKWSELSIEEKKGALAKISELLESKDLESEEILTQIGLQDIQNEYTRPFFNGLIESITNKGIKIDKDRYEPGEKKPRSKYRVHYDEIKISDYIAVYLSLYSKKYPDIRNYLYWGIIKSCSKNDVTKISEKLKNQGVKHEIIDSRGEGSGAWPMIKIDKGKLSSTELREKDPDKLIETITNDIYDLVNNKILTDIFNNKNDTDENEDNDRNKLQFIINAINTKPFIILSGISGTGKTQIARIISAGMVNNDN